MNVAGAAHLTYCTNIHPGENWEESMSALAAHLPPIKRMVSPDAPMGVGLRLSAAAALALERLETLRDFQNFLRREGLYVFTINGFPYGAFHRSRVKDSVYRPNWSEEARLDYTDRLASILAQLLPDDVTGSISTVPGGYLAHLQDGDREQIADNLIRHVAHLHELHVRTGKLIALALEPEPGCLLETSGDVVDFFGTHLHGQAAVQRLSVLTGLPAEKAQQALHRHLGLCLDVCHLAVAYEDLPQTVKRIQDAGIALHKIQLSAALRVCHPDARQKQDLLPFAEDVYLHQTAASGPHGITRWDDLPDALADSGEYDEWRIHYHVPLWAERIGGFSTTCDDVAKLLSMHRQSALTSHLEVETYTWDVLGQDHKPFDLDASIARELQWVQEQLA